MTQQYKKVRPSRAARARAKGQAVPNIPEFTGPDDWDRPAPAPRLVATEPGAPMSNFAAGVAGVQRSPSSAFARAARSSSMEVTQDYSYLKQDMLRILISSALLLIVMLGFAAW